MLKLLLSFFFFACWVKKARKMASNIAILNLFSN